MKFVLRSAGALPGTLLGSSRRSFKPPNRLGRGYSLRIPNFVLGAFGASPCASASWGLSPSFREEFLAQCAIMEHCTVPPTWPRRTRRRHHILLTAGVSDDEVMTFLEQYVNHVDGRLITEACQALRCAPDAISRSR